MGTRHIATFRADRLIGHDNRHVVHLQQFDELDVIDHLCAPTISACKPPHVPKTRPGPCPKAKDLGDVTKIAKVARKTAVAKTGGRSGSSPRSFPGQDAAKAFINEHYGAWRKDLPDREYKGLAAYQSPLFPLINGQLRGLPPAKIKADVAVNPASLARAKAAVKDIDAAIHSAPPLADPILVHRTFAADQFGELATGKVVHDRGYTSTSLTPVTASSKNPTGNAVAHITLPAGTRAAAGQSRELVLPRGSSFRITAISNKAGVTHVSMELVPAR